MDALYADDLIDLGLPDGSQTDAHTAPGAAVEDAPPVAAAPEYDAAEIAARLVTYHEHRATVFDWMHPSRLAAFPYADCLPGMAAAQRSALAELFLNDRGMPPAPLAEFTASGTQLSALSIPACLSMFRLRALLEHGGEIHDWLDKPRRTLLRQWVGQSGARMLLARRRTLGQESQPRYWPEALHEQSPDVLAWCGLRLFERDCGWSSASPLALIQLALPEQIQPEALPRGPGYAMESNGSLTLLLQLPQLFPERSW